MICKYLINYKKNKFDLFKLNNKNDELGINKKRDFKRNCHNI
ncbi:hypothetical protein C8C85_3159 [Flavobacterium sp. 103]|nr:hypothetical protein C8C85_3159 [Flavobacterium sp. 103]